MKKLALLLPLLVLAAAPARAEDPATNAPAAVSAAAKAFDQPDEMVVGRILLMDKVPAVGSGGRLEVEIVSGQKSPAIRTTNGDAETFSFAKTSPQAAAFLARMDEDKPWDHATADKNDFPLDYAGIRTNGWAVNAGFLPGGRSWWAETKLPPDFVERREALRTFAASLMPEDGAGHRAVVGRISLSNDGGVPESAIGSAPFIIYFTEGGPSNVVVQGNARQHVAAPQGPVVLVPDSSDLANRLRALADEVRPWDWKSSDIHAYAGNLSFFGSFSGRKWNWRGIYAPPEHRNGGSGVPTPAEDFANRIRLAVLSARTQRKQPSTVPSAP